MCCCSYARAVKGVCALLQASKLVQPHQGLLELQQLGLALRGSEIPSPAVREAQTCVVPFWTKAEKFHIFVRPFYCSTLSVIRPHCTCAVTGYFPVMLKFTLLLTPVCTTTEPLSANRLTPVCTVTDGHPWAQAACIYRHSRMALYQLLLSQTLPHAMQCHAMAVAV